MAICDDRYVDEFTVVGVGDSEDHAKEDFDNKLKAKRDDAKDKLKCDAKACTGVLGSDVIPDCDFAVAPIGERKCAEAEAPMVFHKGAWKTAKKKKPHWECTQRFKVGCFCFYDDDFV